VVLLLADADVLTHVVADATQDATTDVAMTAVARLLAKRCELFAAKFGFLLAKPKKFSAHECDVTLFASKFHTA